MKAMSPLYSGWRWLKLPIPQILPSQSQSDPNSPRRKKEQDICQKDQASSEDRCRLTSCDSGQFGNEKDNPSKCQETAHSAATVVFQ